MECSASAGVRLGAVVRLLAASVDLALLRLLRHKAGNVSEFGKDTTITSARTRPLEEAIGAPCVDDGVDLDVVASGLVAAVALPIELAGGVRIGVDGDLATPFESHLQQ